MRDNKVRDSKVVRCFLATLLVLGVALVAWNLFSESVDFHRASIDRDRALEWTSPQQSPERDVSAKLPTISAPTLTGFVTDDAGQRISGATVALMPIAEEARAEKELIEGGHFAVTLSDGEFKLSWPKNKQPVLSVRHDKFCSHMEVIAGLPDKPIQVVLERGKSISGRVLLVDGVTPAGGVRVVARGLRAAYRDAQRSLVPAPAAAIHQSRTSDDGSFMFEGLRDGDFQIDVVESGLVVVPNILMSVGREVMLAGHRRVLASAGESEVRVHVVSLVAVAVRVLNEETGSALPFAHVGLTFPDGFEVLHRSGASMNADIALVNGRTYSIARSSRRQGVQARFALYRSFPIPDGASCKVKVIWPGYQEFLAEIPIVPLGTSDDVVVHELQLTPKFPAGSVKFSLRDKDGQAVPHAMTLVISPSARSNEFVTPVVRFDKSGVGESIALPEGSYLVRAAAKPGLSPIEPVEFHVSVGQTTDVALVLQDVGGFNLVVRDRAGSHVDDIGIRTTLGHGGFDDPAGLGSVENGEVRITGIPVLVPGLGSGWSGRLLMGYPAGPVTIEVTRHGYKPATVKTEAIAGRVVSLEVVLEPGSVSGGPAAGR